MPEDYEFVFEAKDDAEAIERAIVLLSGLHGQPPIVVED